MLTTLPILVFLGEPPVITVDRDNVEITQTCIIRIAQRTGPQSPIIDADNNGVIHITAGDISVSFSHDDDSPPLHGAREDQMPDSFAGTGVSIKARNVTLRNAKVSGYKVGIHAINADGLTVHDCDVSNNFHQRLKSTAKAEDASDWLWPHANDDNQWITNYGAGLCVEDSSNVTIHDLKARRGQNGIILDRVNDSKVYDCDCSFLSGWGLALWRSNRNVISRNAFDFCVRGYSHGVYNRGQDSAGILMFEQCCDNVIAENSATHCGDGFFGFAGKEALGEVNPRRDIEWYRRRGCNGNVVVGNDFSYAAAHGLELTFSLGNHIWNNMFINNAICGIWGGYSQDTTIASNAFHLNGDMAYGAERGGVNIEHGKGNLIALGDFTRNACGIRLWSDDDGPLQETPWAQANGTASESNQLIQNRFRGDRVAIELQETTQTQVGGTMFDQVERELEADDKSRAGLNEVPQWRVPMLLPSPPPFPVGSRQSLPGDVPAHWQADSRPSFRMSRASIVMTQWGPWDHESPLLRRVEAAAGIHRYELRKAPRITLVKPASTVDVRALKASHEPSASGDAQLITVEAHGAGAFPYDVDIQAGDRTFSVSGVLVRADWQVIVFPSRVDPRQDLEAWRKQSISNTDAIPVNLHELNLKYGHNGPSQLDLHERLTNANIPKDRFGTIASTDRLLIPPGQWRIRTVSDDGIRVWLNQKLVIDDWTHHPPREHVHEFSVPPTAPTGALHEIRIEHFELDGYAILSLELERVN